MKKHLIIASSFFPSIGGAQGSLLNFIKILGEKNCYVVVGLKSYLWSLNKKKKFHIIPTIFTFLKSSRILADMYIGLILKFVNPNKIWLYGGGDISATFLQTKKSNYSYVLRPAGEDIQIHKNKNYGLRLNLKKKKLIEDNYKKADIIWCLNKNIRDILTKEFKIKQDKTYLVPNFVIKPKKISKKNNKITNIGIIGRNNPKKQFDLALEVAQELANSDFKFFFKTPGFNFTNTNYLIKEPKSIIKNYYNWPPLDVWKFHAKINILLITSVAEGFSNVILESHLLGNIIVMHKNMPGKDILKKYGVKVFFYKEYEKKEIIKSLLKAKNYLKVSVTNEINNIGKTEVVNFIKKING